MTPEEFVRLNKWSEEQIRLVGKIGLSWQDAKLILDSNLGFYPSELFQWCRSESNRTPEPTSSNTAVRVQLLPDEYAKVRDALRVIRDVYVRASAIRGTSNKKWREVLPALHSKSKSIMVNLPD